MNESNSKLIGNSHILSVVVPCYNEEAVLLETAGRLAKLLKSLCDERLIGSDSHVVLVDDGSCDRTWQMISELSRNAKVFRGIKLSRNTGHQNALLSGMLQATGDAIVSIDADLQDDLAAIREMVLAYQEGVDVVYGVRYCRTIDRLAKRITTEGFYKLLRFMGVDVVFNHADYRLMSRRYRFL